MLTFFSDNGVIFGLTRNNLTRLPDEPIMVSYEHARMVKHFAIIFGEDKPAIIAKLREFGVDIPQAVIDSAEEDPA